MSNPTKYVVTLDYVNGDSITASDLQQMIKEDTNPFIHVEGADPNCIVTVELAGKEVVE